MAIWLKVIKTKRGAFQTSNFIGVRNWYPCIWLMGYFDESYNLYTLVAPVDYLTQRFFTVGYFQIVYCSNPQTLFLKNIFHPINRRLENSLRSAR